MNPLQENNSDKLQILCVIVFLLVVIIFLGAKVIDTLQDIKELRIKPLTGVKKVAISYEQYRVLKCESQLKNTAIGDNGDSVGIAQYQTPTFEEFENKYNLTLNINSPKDQLTLMNKMWPEYKDRWSCYKLIN
jgi:hypothetical protein